MVATGMFVLKTPMALPSSLCSNHCGMKTGVPTTRKAPPTPRMNLPVRAIAKLVAVAVNRFPTTTAARERKLSQRKPYLFMISPAGSARMIPGIMTKDMNSPVCAPCTPNSFSRLIKIGGPS